MIVYKEFTEGYIFQVNRRYENEVKGEFTWLLNMKQEKRAILMKGRPNKQQSKEKGMKKEESWTISVRWQSSRNRGTIALALIMWT